MTLPHDTVLELMALADGELQGDARARVEELVATNEEARRVVLAMRGGTVDGWLGEAAHVHAGASGADAVADDVMRALEAEARPAREAGVPAVVSLVAARSARPGRRVVAFVAGGLALAAAVVLYVRAGSPSAPAPVASVAPVVTASAPSASVAQQARPAAGVEVNQIDAPRRGVSVFEIPVGAAAAVAEPSGPKSVVVWVDEDTGAK